jgi:alpha-2-macroglobulin
MQEMGLPVRSLAEALAEDAARAPGSAAQGRQASPLASIVLAEEDGDLQAAMSRLLAAYVVQQAQGTVPAELSTTLEAAVQRVQRAGLPLGEALLLMTGRRPAQDAAGVLEKVRAESATIDRSLTLLWTYRALSGRSGAADNLLRNAISRIELEAPWQAVETATGQRVFRWSAAAAPASIMMAAAPVPGLTAIAQFDSREPETSTLPVQVERRLYRLVRNDSATASGPAGYDLQLLPKDAVLKTDEVYLDEVVLKRTAGSPVRFGIVEVPLPPGMSADRSTWGMAVRFPGKDSPEALERARYEQTPRGYAVPVDVLNDEMVIRHLVRPGQTGKFALLPARYYRMYQPEQKAFEEKHRARIEIR